MITVGFVKTETIAETANYLKNKEHLKERKRGEKMSYTYSIRSGVDERLLQSAIGIFRTKHENMFVNPYIFINKKTFDDLYKLLNPNDSNRIRKDEKLGFLCYYQGCKMFEDNTLDYGEVELR